MHDPRSNRLRPPNRPCACRTTARLAARTARAIAVALVLGLCASGCAPSSRITQLWKDPAYSGAPMKSMMVFCIKKDPVRQRVWEDAFVTELAKCGVQATPSYTLFVNGQVDTLKAHDAIDQGVRDGFLMVKNLGKDTKTTVIPGMTTREVVGRHYDPVWRTFETVYREVKAPDYVETETVRSYESNLFSGGDERQLVWSGESAAVNAESSQDAGQKTAKTIVAGLRKSGLIRAAK